MDREQVPRPGQVDNAADGRGHRDQAYGPAAQLGVPPGHYDRPQAGAVHERHPGQVEQEPRATLAHGAQQDVLQRSNGADVDVSADRHDGAVTGGADA